MYGDFDLDKRVSALTSFLRFTLSGISLTANSLVGVSLSYPSRTMPSLPSPMTFPRTRFFTGPPEGFFSFCIFGRCCRKRAFQFPPHACLCCGERAAFAQGGEE